MKTIADHILDICQNSIRAKATLIEIIIEENKYSDIYNICIRDNGKGMNQELLKQAGNPFFTTRKTRNVGMGLALLKQNAEASGGDLKIESEPGKGTWVKAGFCKSNIDCLPIGNLAETFILMIIGNEKLIFQLTYKYDQKEYIISSKELKDIIGNTSVWNKDIRQGISELIEYNINKIKAENKPLILTD